MSIRCERFHDSKFFIWGFRDLKVLELWTSSYMQIVLWRLIKLNFPLILSTILFFLIIWLFLDLLNLSILIWWILIINSFIDLLYILFINELRILSFWSIIIHCSIFWIFIVVWVMHVAALRLIDCFICDWFGFLPKIWSINYILLLIINKQAIKK